MNPSDIRGNREKSGIEVSILWASLNQDGGVGFSPAMKVLIPILIGLLAVGCGEVENGAYKHRLKTNESTPTTKTNNVDGASTRPVNEPTLREKVVGTYELKRYGGWEKLVLLNTGVFEAYHDGKVEEAIEPSPTLPAETPSPSIPTTQETNEAQPKTDSKSKEETKNPDANPIVEKAVLEVEGKWKITNGEIHQTNVVGGINVYRINKDGSFAAIARIQEDGKRYNLAKTLQLTYKIIN